jgi:chromosome segregation ATPase
MKTHVVRRLSTLSEEISETSAELGRLRDRLAAQLSVLDDCRLRMLLAETPLADRDLRVADRKVRAIQGEVGRLEESLSAMRLEQRRLSGLLSADV